MAVTEQATRISHYHKVFRGKAYKYESCDRDNGCRLTLKDVDLEIYTLDNVRINDEDKYFIVEKNDMCGNTNNPIIRFEIAARRFDVEKDLSVTHFTLAAYVEEIKRCGTFQLVPGEIYSTLKAAWDSAYPNWIKTAKEAGLNTDAR